MEKVLITEVCDILVGRTPSRYNPVYWGTGFPWLSIADMNQGESLSSTKETITTEAVKECNCKIVPKGTVLFSFKLSIGKVGITAVDMFTNEAIAAFLIKDKSRLDTKFLFYTLKSTDYSIGSNKAVMGKTLNKEQLKKFTIPLPSIEEQHRIVKILDLAQSLIEKRKQAISYLDDYIKLVFLDMFGDPVSNPKKFPLTRLGTLGDWQSGGTPSRKNPDYFRGSIPWYSSGELNDIFISDSNEYISEIAVKESSTKIIPVRCLLLGMYDSAALKSSITTNESSCNQAIAFAKLDENKANIIYVYHCIQYGKNHYKKNQRGVRQKNLNLSMIKSLQIPIPKINDQNEFEKIFNKSFHLKQKMQSQLKELENNFQAQLQMAFRRDLK